MKILVAVVEVANVEEGFGIEDRAIEERYLNYGLNEWDEYAIEAAVRIAEAGADGATAEGDGQGGADRTEAVEVVSATIGPERAEETIRTALAKGVDRAIRVWDDALESADYLDVAAKTAILDAVVEAEEPDLVLAGVQSADDAAGATGVGLAERAGFEWAAVVNHLEYAVGEDRARVHRELEGGIEEITDIELPAVLTIQTGINDPRYASLRGIKQAQSKEIDAKGLGDLGLDEGVIETPTTLTEMCVPDAASDATVFEGAPDEAASQLADLLRERGIEG